MNNGLQGRLRGLQSMFSFKANFLQSQLAENAKGTTSYAAVRPQRLLVCEVPLPPIKEQRRIVTRVQEVTGKIVEATALRAEICSQTDALAGSAARALFERLPDVTHLPLEALAEIKGGVQKSPKRSPGANPVRYLTVAHVQRNRILIEDPRYFEASLEELEKWRLKAGDVLIIEGNGSSEQIGRTALFRGELENCIHQNHVIRIRANQDVINPEFLNAYLNSPVGQSSLQAQARSTSGLQTLSVRRLKSVEVPVPSLEEQTGIVAYLGVFEKNLERLRAVQTETATELEVLLSAILDRAFKGEL